MDRRIYYNAFDIYCRKVDSKLMSKSWRIYAANTRKLEDRYTPSIKRIITSFRNKFISDLKKYGEQEARNQLSQHVMSDDIANVLQSIYRTAGLMGAKMQDA